MESLLITPIFLKTKLLFINSYFATKYFSGGDSLDVNKILKLKVMSSDFKEIGKVKSLEVQNWRIIGLRVELSKEITRQFFGKSTFRLMGEETLLLSKLVKNIGDVVILTVTGPNLMVYSKLGQIFTDGCEQIKREINSINDINKFANRVEEQVNSFLKEVNSILGASEEVKSSIAGDLGLVKEHLIASAYEKLGVERGKEFADQNAS